MSLRGRYVIDRVKRAVSQRFLLPCPPYGVHTYWEGVYQKLGPSDCYEWGGISLETDLLHHRYDPTAYEADVGRFGYYPRRGVPPLGGIVESSSAAKIFDKEGRVRDEDAGTVSWNGVEDDDVGDDGPYAKTTFGEAIGVQPGEKDKRILLLGCGNSRMGEEMIDHGWSGPIIQTDVSRKAVTDLTERCESYISSGSMECVCDDATCLTAFEPESMDSVVDKGLVDALFCANRPDQLEGVMSAVHRTLVPGGVWCFFSFSRPEFLLDQILGEPGGKRLWNDVQIRALDPILMYRFIKKSYSDQKEPLSNGRKQDFWPTMRGKSKRQLQR